MPLVGSTLGTGAGARVSGRATMIGAGGGVDMGLDLVGRALLFGAGSRAARDFSSRAGPFLAGFVVSPRRWIFPATIPFVKAGPSFLAMTVPECPSL